MGQITQRGFNLGAITIAAFALVNINGTLNALVPNQGISSISHDGTGQWTVNFSAPFTLRPAVFVTPGTNNSLCPMVILNVPSQVGVNIFLSSTGAAADSTFYIMALGS